MKNFIPCSMCGKKANWSYMPGVENYCDNCVPRGCTCNQDENGVESLDDHGRKSPCCEFHEIFPDQHDIPVLAQNGWESYFDYHPEERIESYEVDFWEKKLGVDKEE